MNFRGAYIGLKNLIHELGHINAKSVGERVFYLSKEIENYFTSVFKQTMYTEFEQDLYHTKLFQHLTPKILSEKYEKLIKKYYGTDIVCDEISSVEWTRLGHLYRWSYYPYKYATGLIIGSIVVNSLLDEHSLLKEQYLEFSSSGSSLYSLDLLKMLDIDLTNFNIIQNGLKVLESDIEEIDKLLANMESELDEI